MLLQEQGVSALLNLQRAAELTAAAIASQWWTVRVSDWACPPLQLVFIHACDTDKPELKSVAPEGTELEILESRMKWIGAAAKDFHKLMQIQKNFMEGELRTIAGWVNMPDKT